MPFTPVTRSLTVCALAAGLLAVALLTFWRPGASLAAGGLVLLWAVVDRSPASAWAARWIERSVLAVVAAALLACAAVLAAARPVSVLLAGAAIGAVAWADWRALGAVLGRGAARVGSVLRLPLVLAATAAALVCASLLMTVRPVSVLLAGLALGAITLADRRALARAVRRGAARGGPILGLLALPGAILAGAGVLAGAVLVLGAWPHAAMLAIVVSGGLYLAWTQPALGLVASVLLVGVEGTIKIALTRDGLPISPEAVGAVAIDLVVFASTAHLLWLGRDLVGLRAIAGLRGRRRLVAFAGLAWLGLSLLQIAQGGRLLHAAGGFRLFQLYVLVAPAAYLAFREGRPDVERALLAVFGLIAAYAAFRVLTGPTAAERSFALAKQTVSAYGGAFRAIGSFSGAVGLISFLTPLTTFCLGFGILERGRVRTAALAAGGLGLVGLIASYGRAALIALAVALFVLFVLNAGGLAGRGRWRVGLTVLALFAVGGGGVAVASRASPQVSERISNILHPGRDQSANLRASTYRHALREAEAHPLGLGLGRVGAASAAQRSNLVTTDDSYLKVLVEQGWLGLALFLAGAGGAVVLIGARLRRLPARERALGVAALCGTVSFLVLALFGEYTEQPGKVAAWALLGLAAAEAFRPRPVEVRA